MLLPTKTLDIVQIQDNHQSRYSKMPCFETKLFLLNSSSAQRNKDKTVTKSFENYTGLGLIFLKFQGRESEWGNLSSEKRYSTFAHT